jgi:hypothetical protein
LSGFGIVDRKALGRPDTSDRWSPLALDVLLATVPMKFTASASGTVAGRLPNRELLLRELPA